MKKKVFRLKRKAVVLDAKIKENASKEKQDANVRLKEEKPKKEKKAKK